MNLLDSPRVYEELMDNLYEGVYLLDTERRITYWNKGAENLTGYAAEEVIGSCCADNILMHVDSHGESLCRGACPVSKTLEDGKRREARVFLHHKAGHRVPVHVRVAPIKDAQGTVIGAIEVFSDSGSSSALIERVEQLRKLAFFDSLTGIGNRRHADAMLEARLAETRRYGWTFGLLIADIDHFKHINDTYGHAAGDRVLQMAAATLARGIRSFDTVARWGGEEFLVILAHVERAECQAAGERLRRLVEESSITTPDGVLSVTVSIGAALSRADDTAASIVDRADELLYKSKRAGRNRVTMETE